ncbi:hypothetical protein ACNO7P_10850 [Bisgaard Taxon 45]
MKRLIIKQVTVLSKDKNEGNQFVFRDGINFIISNKNSAGKTTLLNLIYSTLGCVIKFKDEWVDSFVRLDISIGDKSYTLYKTPNKLYYIQDESSLTKYVKASDYHKDLAEIIGYKIYLKDRSGIPKITRPAHFFLTSYISQVKGWTAFFPDSFENLGEFPKFKTDLIEQFCKVKSDQELENEEELKELKNSLDKKSNEQAVLSLTKGSFESNVGASLDELKNLAESYEKQLNSLQEELSDVVIERQFLLNEIAFSTSTIQELVADYQVARQNASKIECPYCGTIHSNTITEKSELFFLKTKLEDDLIHQESQIQGINDKIHEIESKISEITELKRNSSALIIDNTKQFVKAMAIHGLSDVLINIEKDIAELEKRKNIILGIKRKNRKNYKNYRNSVDEFFISKLKQYADKLSITFSSYDTIKKVTDYNKVLSATKGGAADSNRVILAYYLAIYATAMNFNAEILPPLVLDTPNQNEQDKENYQSIINTLMQEENKQILICLIKSEYSETLNNVNRVWVDRIMKAEDYQEFFSPILN